MLEEEKVAIFSEDLEFQKKMVYEDILSSHEDYYSLSCYWQVIEFLINGPDSLLKLGETCELVYGGLPIDSNNDVWFDFGPMRYFTQLQVQEISSTLNKLSSETVLGKYSKAKMVEHHIHPDNWWDIDEDNFILQVKYYYEGLIKFFNRASENGYCVITYIT